MSTTDSVSNAVLRRWPAALFSAFAVLTFGAAEAYEEPAYRVIEKNDVFEIRDYEPYLVAEVEVRADFKKAGNQAFRVLFDYISGENIRQEEISMTVPVNQQSVHDEGEKIEMTTPVLQTPGAEEVGTYRFSFVMPAEYTLDTLPLPKDERIEIRQVPAKKVAVLRYSGSWSESNYRKNESLLLTSLADRELATEGQPIYARYNSPFTLWFLRRNEVLVELAPR